MGKQRKELNLEKIAKYLYNSNTEETYAIISQILKLLGFSQIRQSKHM